MTNSIPRPSVPSKNEAPSKQATPSASPPSHENQSNPDSPTEKLYVDNDAYFDNVLLAIRQAKYQIELEAYIFQSSELGKLFVAALSEAASKGVLVRVMVDGAGIDENFTQTARALVSQGVQLRIYRPLPWRLAHWQFSRAKSQGLRKFWRLLSDINRRNHRKMLIIDRRQLWLGSMNISQAHLSKQRGGQGWRDTAIALVGEHLQLPLRAFDIAWNRSRRRQRFNSDKAFKHSPFLFNFTRKLRIEHRRVLLEKIEHAQQEIWITNAYFVPDSALLKALERAALRQVDVRILLPKLSDVFFMPWVSSVFYLRLMKSGVRVYEYLPSMLHAKTLVIDNWARVGSSNLNRRSLAHDLELDYCPQQSETVDQLKLQYETDLAMSDELDKTTLSANKHWQRWFGLLFLIVLARWL